MFLSNTMWKNMIEEEEEEALLIQVEQVKLMNNGQRFIYSGPPGISTIGPKTYFIDQSLSPKIFS